MTRGKTLLQSFIILSSTPLLSAICLRGISRIRNCGNWKISARESLHACHLIVIFTYQEEEQREICLYMCVLRLTKQFTVCVCVCVWWKGAGDRCFKVKTAWKGQSLRGLSQQLIRKYCWVPVWSNASILSSTLAQTYNRHTHNTHGTCYDAKCQDCPVFCVTRDVNTWV